MTRPPISTVHENLENFLKERVTVISVFAVLVTLFCVRGLGILSDWILRELSRLDARNARQEKSGLFTTAIITLQGNALSFIKSRNVRSKRSSVSLCELWARLKTWFLRINDKRDSCFAFGEIPHSKRAKPVLRGYSCFDFGEIPHSKRAKPVLRGILLF